MVQGRFLLLHNLNRKRSDPNCKRNWWQLNDVRLLHRNPVHSNTALIDFDMTSTMSAIAGTK